MWKHFWLSNGDRQKFNYNEIVNLVLMEIFPCCGYYFSLDGGMLFFVVVVVVVSVVVVGQ